ncbi:MAG: DUF3160 domain-containing protein [Bacteroidota bacterium]|nr:DUF3160 domain-containing protein [Bacteroidota bacterium]
MKRMLPIGLKAAWFILCTAAVSQAQQVSFDIDAYRNYLATHRSMTGGGILREYPAPVFHSKAQLAGEPRYLDSVTIKFRLTDDERSLLRENGFVVTERLSAYSFGEAYGQVWRYDLPVFVSSDAILHAVHMSYDEILMETEFRFLIPRLNRLLESLHEKALPELDQRYRSVPAMGPSLRDVDVYLTVARRLLSGEATPVFYKGNENVVAALLALIDAQSPAEYTLFASTPRTIDFSQFTVRGHYLRDPLLGMYFRSMIWLGRTEFMLTKPVQHGGPGPTDEDIQRQVIGAWLLKEALERDGSLEVLNEIDDMLEFLVGESDNVRVPHLEELQREVGFTDASALADMDVVRVVQERLASKPYAGQRINAQILMSDPMNPEQIEPPSAFLLLGQRFIIDSYVFWNVVYDNIEYEGQKVRRMLPRALDAMFAVGNDAAAQFLQDDLDRYHYAPNLAALRYLVDSFDGGFWNASLYNAWLNAIRALNPPDMLESLPPFMRTAAWWQAKLNTQLASWAQLRHDNILYAKQSYSGGVTCSFPEGYVEPVPELYLRLGRFARDAESVYRAKGILEPAAYFTGMGEIMDTLAAIAGKERDGEPLTAAEAGFLSGMLYATPRGCAPAYDGWYQRLFYRREITDHDFIIADVHTAPTDENGNMVGWVLHVAVGKVDMGFVVAPSPNGGDVVYTGAMMSYHEQVSTNFKRYNDVEWTETVRRTSQARPDWVNVYLADGKGMRRVPGPVFFTETSPVERTATHTGGPLLHPAHPNPFTDLSGTLIPFTLSAVSPSARLEVYDLTGRLVRTLVDDRPGSGNYAVRWDGRDARGMHVPAGTYIVRLTSGNAVSARPVTLLR